MKKPKVDRETEEVMSVGEKAKDVVESDAWKELRRRLLTMTINLSSIEDLDEDSNNVVAQIRANKIAISIIMKAIAEIEGEADQYEMNKGMFEKQRHEALILQLDG